MQLCVCACVCVLEVTNKEPSISDILHKRHQLKAWFIISSGPLWPIKDKDGDKKPSAAGRQQTDKTDMATEADVWKPPVA